MYIEGLHVDKFVSSDGKQASVSHIPLRTLVGVGGIVGTGIGKSGTKYKREINTTSS